MRLQTIVRFVGLGILALAAFTPLVRAQTELDRVVARVNNRIITRSDVRQARLLQLVEHTATDDAARRDLENRMLILGDAARSAPLAPITASDLADRRRQWEARIGGSAKAGRLLTEAGMNDAGLMSWLGDDLRVQAYLQRQFGSLPDAERPRAIEEWITRLRLRAGLR
jgi:hypothetical protein